MGCLGSTSFEKVPKTMKPSKPFVVYTFLESPDPGTNRPGGLRSAGEVRRPRRGFRRVGQLHQILCKVFCKSCRTLWSFPFEKALLGGLRSPLSGLVGAFRGNPSWAFSDHVGPSWLILALLAVILPILFAILAPRCPNIARKWSIGAELEANTGQHDLQDA